MGAVQRKACGTGMERRSGEKRKENMKSSGMQLW